MKRTPNKERIQKAVDAMRFGKYKKTEGTLRDNRGHCALGVMCDIYAQENKVRWWRKSERDYYGRFMKTDYADYTILGEDAVLPDEVAEWYGFDDKNPVVKFLDPYVSEGEEPEIIEDHITELNDNYTSVDGFVVIADALHKTYEL